jgi:O-antigen/teichoic acid export membrane protein
MTIVFVIASLSLNTYILKHYYNEVDNVDRKNLVGSIFYFILIFNVVLLLLQFFLGPIIIDFFRIDIPFYPFFALSILNNFFDVIAIVPLVIYRVNENAKGFIIVSLSRTILQYILVLIFVVHLKYGLEGSYYGRLLANIPFVFVYFYYVYKNSNFRLDIGIVKKALKFSIPLLPGSISYILISLSDRIILERYIILDQIGIYSVAFTLALTLNIVIQALYKTIEPVLFREYQGEKFQEINYRLYRVYLGLLFIGGFATAIFSKEVFLIATSNSFLVGYKIVPFLVISVIISGINTYLDILLIAEQKQKIVSYTTILSGCISVVVNLILIPHMGYYGALIASISSFLVVNVICQSKVFIEKKHFSSQVALIFMIAFVPYFFDRMVPVKGILYAMVIKLVFLLVFCGLTLKLVGLNFRKLKIV